MGDHWKGRKSSKMEVMHDLIKKLHTIDSEFNPPATSEMIELMEFALGCKLDPDLRLLYEDHNGVPQNAQVIRFPMRLMSHLEVIGFHHDLQADAPDAAFDHNMLEPVTDFPIRYFWTDYNSNYAGIYIDGSLKGKMCWLNNEGFDPSTRFRSVQRFYAVGLEIAAQNTDDEYFLGWNNMPMDFPKRYSDPAYDQEDEALAGILLQHLATLLEAAKHEQEHRYQAFNVINLLPLHAREKLLPFVYDKDMWVQAHAIRLLGMRKDVNAVPLLAEMAINAQHFGKSEAIMALGYVGTLEAIQVLKNLSDQVMPTFKIVIASALRLTGYQTDYERQTSSWYYRASENDEWVLI